MLRKREYWRINSRRDIMVVVQLLSHVQLFASPWTVVQQPSLSFTVSLVLLKLMSVESVMPSNHLILCYPLLLSSAFPRVRVFSSESVLASILPTNIQSWFPLELTGLLSLRSKGLSRVFSNTTIWKKQSFWKLWDWRTLLLP